MNIRNEITVLFEGHFKKFAENKESLPSEPTRDWYPDLTEEVRALQSLPDDTSEEKLIDDVNSFLDSFIKATLNDTIRDIEETREAQIYISDHWHEYKKALGQGISAEEAKNVEASLLQEKGIDLEKIKKKIELLGITDHHVIFQYLKDLGLTNEAVNNHCQNYILKKYKPLEDELINGCRDQFIVLYKNFVPQFNSEFFNITRRSSYMNYLLDAVRGYLVHICETKKIKSNSAHKFITRWNVANKIVSFNLYQDAFFCGDLGKFISEICNNWEGIKRFYPLPRLDSLDGLYCIAKEMHILGRELNFARYYEEWSLDIQSMLDQAVVKITSHTTNEHKKTNELIDKGLEQVGVQLVDAQEEAARKQAKALEDILENASKIAPKIGLTKKEDQIKLSRFGHQYYDTKSENYGNLAASARAADVPETTARRWRNKIKGQFGIEAKKTTKKDYEESVKADYDERVKCGKTTKHSG